MRWKQTHHAWAVWHRDAERLAGVFYFGTNLQPWHDGCRVALFRTREQARAAIKGNSYSGFLTPVKVEVSFDGAL